MSGSSRELLACVADIARQAGREILEVYGAGEVAALMKADRSPLTAADLAAHRSICEALHSLTPGVPVLSEEAADTPFATRAGWQRYWLVDPLDGTREFVKRNGEFTVNIALVEDRHSVLGVVLAPVSGELYVAEQGQGAWLQAQADAPWQRIRTRALGQPVLVAGSRSHGGVQGDVLQRVIGSDYQLVPLGSSLKFCLIARGAADVYLRLGLTSEWDTAAAQCVLEEAGGAVLDLAGQPFRYNRGESLLNPEFIAVGDGTIDWAARLQAP